MVEDGHMDMTWLEALLKLHLCYVRFVYRASGK